MTASPPLLMTIDTSTTYGANGEGVSREVSILNILEEVEELLDDDLFVGGANLFPTTSSSPFVAVPTLSSTTAAATATRRGTRSRGAGTRDSSRTLSKSNGGNDKDFQLQ